MTTDATLNRGLAYSYAEPIDAGRLSDQDVLFQELVAAPAFQRLKSIRFLGGIDYLLVRAPNGVKGNVRYTRYQHSLGVARLALFYSAMKELSVAERRIAYAAALLHDIGHAPLSHSLEPVFKQYFDLDHHRATADIISGRVTLGRPIYEVLKLHRMDVERVIAVIFGQDSSFDGFFDGPVNFDTIEGILRAQHATGLNRNILDPKLIVKAATTRSSEADRRLVDGFWSCKDQVYKHVINSPTGVLADYACQRHMIDNIRSLSTEDYFSSEEALFAKLPGLRELLKSKSFYSELIEVISEPVAYNLRTFSVNSAGDFFAREDRIRYVQRKETRFVSPSNTSMGGANSAGQLWGTELRQEVFDYDAIRT